MLCGDWGDSGPGVDVCKGRNDVASEQYFWGNTSSSSVGAAVRAARDGGETHAGGPRSVEYSGWMDVSLSIVCSGALMSVCLETGESYLLESVSAVTFFLPGTWSTRKRNIIDLSLKLSSRGL